MLTLHTSGVQVKILLSVITGRSETVTRSAAPKVVAVRYIPIVATYCKTPYLRQNLRSRTVSPYSALQQTIKNPEAVQTNAIAPFPAEADWHQPELIPKSKDVAHRIIIPDAPSARGSVHPAASRMSITVTTANQCVAVILPLTSQKTITSRSSPSPAKEKLLKTSRARLNDQHAVRLCFAESLYLMNHG